MPMCRLRVSNNEKSRDRQPARGIINLAVDDDVDADDETMTAPANPTSECPSFFVSTDSDIHRCSNVASGSNAQSP